MPSFSFPKKEKLKHTKLFDLLFDQGQSKYVYPIRLVWVKVDQKVNDAPILAGVTVSKRNFKKAYQRNRIKRQLREAYRLNKHRLMRTDQVPHAAQHAVLFIYTSKREESYRRISKAMENLTKHLERKLSQ